MILVIRIIILISDGYHIDNFAIRKLYNLFVKCFVHDMLLYADCLSKELCHYFYIHFMNL